MEEVISCYNLSEEYISALGNITNGSVQDPDVVNASPYLIHGAVTCLETAMSLISKKVGTSALVQWELVIRYRLAQTLMYHTTNCAAAENILSKGILLADKSELVVFKLELQLLMVQLLKVMNHVSAAVTSVDAVIKGLTSGSSFTELTVVEKNHFILSYTFMKIFIDPQRCSAEFEALQNYSTTEYPGVSVSSAIIYALFCIQTDMNYSKALSALNKVTVDDGSNTELRILHILTTLFACLGSGNLVSAKKLMSELHTSLDSVDWNSWRHSVPIGLVSSPLWVSICPQEKIMLNAYLASGIFYLLTGKISLSLRFLQQGQSAVASYASRTSLQSLDSYSSLLNFYLTLAYFESSQWNQGYKAMKPYLKKFPKSLNKYLCGVYFQATGKLDQAEENYCKVLSLEDDDKKASSELSMLAKLNLAVLRHDVESWKKVSVEYNQLFESNEQLKTLDLVVQNSFQTLDVTRTSQLGSQVKYLFLCLAVQNSPHDSSHARVSLSKEAHTESLKTKNWLWSWISGSFLHENLVENGSVLAAEAQLQQNQSLHAGLKRLYSGN